MRIITPRTKFRHLFYVLILWHVFVSSINKQVFGPHRDPPCLKVVTDKMEVRIRANMIFFPANNVLCARRLMACSQEYRAGGTTWITAQEFQDLILRWVEKDLRAVLVNKAAIAIMGAPLLAVTARNAGRKVPRMKDAVDKVPTPLLAAVFSVGLLFLQDVRLGRQ